MLALLASSVGDPEGRRTITSVVVLLIVLVVRPLRWARHRAKLALHALLSWRKGEPDEVG